MTNTYREDAERDRIECKNCTAVDKEKGVSEIAADLL